MSDADVITHLQQIALNFDYDHDVPDPVGIIIDALRKARPEASREQLLTAIRRAEIELTLRVTAVDGWPHDGGDGPYLKYDIADPRWEWLERMKSHIYYLMETTVNI
jgi:hypothetical protein